MASLPNYLRTHRKLTALSQEEVGFLLGFNGAGKESKVSRDENFRRAPSLQDALAYELLYGRPARELFAGVFEQVEQEVTKRAKVLSHRRIQKPSPRRGEVIGRLISELTV